MHTSPSSQPDRMRSPSMYTAVHRLRWARPGVIAANPVSGALQVFCSVVCRPSVDPSALETGCDSVECLRARVGGASLAACRHR